ncbi:MAG: hypothetical protein N3F05_02855 [Candidatus Diapherotrites archaeon]|nr:hypothetical protein [Candidatus Diapherotrites archaeon]
MPKVRNFVFLLLLLSTGVLGLAEVLMAENINGVYIRRIAPQQAYAGEKIWIGFHIENKSSQEKEISIRENIGAANFDQNEAQYIETDYGAKFWNYFWKIKLGPGESASIAYWIEPKNIGAYVITPAEAIIEQEKFYLKSHSIDIKCAIDGKCSSNLGENYINCPEDCNTGYDDKICDMATDGICDPDCVEDFDKDCEKPKKDGSQTGILKPVENSISIELIIAILIIVVACALSVHFLLLAKGLRKARGKS